MQYKGIVKDIKQIAVLDTNHCWSTDCGVCGKDCLRTAMVDLVYTFEPCKCDIEPRYEHLVEHLYHRRCFEKSGN